MPEKTAFFDWKRHLRPETTVERVAGKAYEVPGKVISRAAGAAGTVAGATVGRPLAKGLATGAKAAVAPAYLGSRELLGRALGIMGRSPGATAGAGLTLALGMGHAGANVQRQQGRRATNMWTNALAQRGIPTMPKISSVAPSYADAAHMVKVAAILRRQSQLTPAAVAELEKVAGKIPGGAYRGGAKRVSARLAALLGSGAKDMKPPVTLGMRRGPPGQRVQISNLEKAFKDLQKTVEDGSKRKKDRARSYMPWIAGALIAGGVGTAMGIANQGVNIGVGSLTEKARRKGKEKDYARMLKVDPSLRGEKNVKPLFETLHRASPYVAGEPILAAAAVRTMLETPSPVEGVPFVHPKTMREIMDLERSRQDTRYPFLSQKTPGMPKISPAG